MADGFFPPSLAKSVKQKNTFSNREVGVTHPDTPAFIRLTDTGDIQIMVDNALGIIINKEHNSITLMANTIRFITTDHEGLAWNSSFFNSNATVYTQPALNPATGFNVNNVFVGAENYYNNVSSAATTFKAGDQQPGSTQFPGGANLSQDLANTNVVSNNNALQPNFPIDVNTQPNKGS
jgi:hypothetical protein